MLMSLRFLSHCVNLPQPPPLVLEVNAFEILALSFGLR